MEGENLLTYELKVELLGAKPRIYRVLRVAADTDLAQLHEILQVAMGWENYHLYCFIADGRRYGEPLESGADPQKTCLSEVLDSPGDSLTYIYDFGDEWRHSVQLEKVSEKKHRQPVCLEAQGACPPEDSGGVHGYRQMLDALQDEEHPHREDAVCWLGERFERKACDADAINRQLKEAFGHNSGCFGSPTCLEDIFEQFLLQQKDRLSQKTYWQYEGSIASLRSALNGYAYEHADVSYDLLQEAGKTLCEGVGSEVLLKYLPSFYSYYLPRKMFASEETVRQCGTTIRRLLKWMGERDLLSEEQVTDWRSRVLDMTKRGRHAARVAEYCDDWPGLVPSGEPDEFIEDHVIVEDIEPRRLKLREALGSCDFGWVEVPSDFAEMCCEGMTLAAELQRFGDQWYAADIYNAYPVSG